MGGSSRTQTIDCDLTVRCEEQESGLLSPQLSAPSASHLYNGVDINVSIFYRARENYRTDCTD